MAKKAETPNRKKANYWQSKSVSDLIVTQMSNYTDWLVPEGQQPWQALREDVIRNNSKGRRKGTPRTGRELMDEIEYDDGVGSYPRQRAGLFVFADLLIRFHKRMSKKYGKDYLDQIRATFRSDPQAKTFLAVYETHIGSRSALVNALEQIGRRGIDFKTVGGIRGGYRERDCGIKPMAELTMAIERCLMSLLSEKKQTQSIAAHRTKNADRRKVVVIPHRADHIELSSNNRRCPLHGKGAIFILLLFLRKKAVSYQELWETLYPDEKYEFDNSGQAEKFRQLKSSTERQIRKHLQTPTNGGGWISCVKSFGYELNRKAADWVNPKDFKTIKENLLKSKREEIARQIENECDD